MRNIFAALDSLELIVFLIVLMIVSTVTFCTIDIEALDFSKLVNGFLVLRIRVYWEFYFLAL
jgi:hypothetical protein